MSNIIYKMNIIDFCNSNNIKWFPIILKDKKPVPINHPLYKRTKTDGTISYTPHYIEFSEINDIILESRQELFYTNEIYDFVDHNSIVKIAIDTNHIFQIDIDTPHIDERILYNWIKNNDTKSAYYKSLTKDYGYHIFINVDSFHDFIKDYTSTKNRFQFRKQYTNGDGDFVNIFDDDKNGVELLTGQWGYADPDTFVFNKNITTINKNDLPFFTDLLQVNKNIINVDIKTEDIKIKKEIINSKYRFDNQEIYDHMNNISQTYIDKRYTHFKIICALLSAGYDNIAHDCMYRSSNTKNKDLEKEFESFKKSNNNSISINSFFYYSKISDEKKYYELLRKHRGTHLREEYKRQLFSLNFITDTLNTRFLPYSILENIDTNINTITHIKSHLGSGKTTIIKQFIKNNPNIKKILYFAPRILFARDIYNDLKDYDFKLYNKLKKKDYYNTERIIIQLESLWKVNKTEFDLIIIDEVESVLKQLTSKITNKNIVETYKNFQYLINNCKTIITADAFLSNNSIDVINSIKPDCISRVIVNNFNPYKRKAYEVAGFKNLVKKAIDQVNSGERIVFITLIKNNGDYAYSDFKSECPNKKIKYYYGSMNEKDKTFDNINEEWKDVDILIYTPIITCGVNYNFESFHSLYLWISPNSCCIRDLFQASLRVRKLINNDCYFAFNYTYNKFSKKCDVISKIFENSEGNILNIYKNLLEKQEYMIELGVAIPRMCDWGIKNLSYAIFEDYISNNQCVKTTHEYLRRCGYEIYPLETLPNFDDCFNNNGETTCAYSYEELDDIRDDEYRLLEQNIYDSDEIDKYLMIKYKFNKMLGVSDEIYKNVSNASKFNIHILFSKFHRKLHIVQNILNELNGNKPCIKEIVYDINEKEQKNYDLYVDTNVICSNLNNDIKNLLNCNNMIEIEYSTNDIKNNINEWLNVIDKAKKIYNFREDRGDEKNNFKYVNSCIKHIIRNYIGCDISGSRKRINGKLCYVYHINTKKSSIPEIHNIIKEVKNID